MSRFAKLYVLLLVVVTALLVISFYPGITPDMSAGDIFKVFGF